MRLGWAGAVAVLAFACGTRAPSTAPSAATGGAAPQEAGDAGATAADPGSSPEQGQPDAGVPLETLDFSSPAPPTEKPKVIDETAGHIFAVSSDGGRVLYSHGRHADWGPASGCDCFCHPVEDVVLASASDPSSRIVLTDKAMWATFSADGRSIAFGMGDCASNVYLAASDGSGARLLGSGASLFAGRWLYFEDVTKETLSLYRVQHPGGQPELLARYPRPPPPPESFPFGTRLQWGASRDGEEFVYQDPSSGTWHLHARSGPDVALPGLPRGQSDDGSWLVTAPCDVIDEAGHATHVCDQMEAHAFSPDNAKLAIAQSDGGVVVDELATGTIIRLPPLTVRSSDPVTVEFTPDERRIVARFGDTVSVAPISGGSWTTFDGWQPRISQDSHVVFAETLQGLVASVDGKPPVPVVASDGTRLWHGPFLEPPGGLDLAQYATVDYSQLLIASGNGSGPWALLPEGIACSWPFPGSMLCGQLSPDPSAPKGEVLPRSERVFVVPDDRSVVTLLDDRVIESAVANGKFFYVRSTDGLHVVDIARSP